MFLILHYIYSLIYILNTTPITEHINININQLKKEKSQMKMKTLFTQTQHKENFVDNI